MTSPEDTTIMASAHRSYHGYRLTRPAFVARAVLIGALMAASMTDSCARRLRFFRSAGTSDAGMTSRGRDQRP